MNEFSIIGPLQVVVRETCGYTIEPLPSPISLYVWTVEHGEIISGQGTQNIEVLWNHQGYGKVIVEIIPPGSPPKTSHIVVVVDPINEQ